VARKAFIEGGTRKETQRDRKTCAQETVSESAQLSTESGQVQHFGWGATFEHRYDVEAWASRWRDARLGDEGFPDFEQALQVYRPLRVTNAPIVARGGHG
jgi:hypothetical protein